MVSYCVLQVDVNTGTFNSSIYIVKSVVMYIYVRGFAPVFDFQIGFWNSPGILSFLFSTNLRAAIACLVLEKFDSFFRAHFCFVEN